VKSILRNCRGSVNKKLPADYAGSSLEEAKEEKKMKMN
jgi:hypothetical protein